MMPFIDRTDAGRRLAKALARYKGQHPVVLALPRGGVPVAAEVAAALDAPLDLILVRKIGVPTQPELAMGAVVDGMICLETRELFGAIGYFYRDFRQVSAQEVVAILKSFPAKRPVSIP